MPEVTSIGNQVPRSGGIFPEVAGFLTGFDAIGYEGLGSWGPQASRCGGGHYRQGSAAERKSTWCTISFGRRGCRQ
jgi:hypothetical protein